MTNEKLEALSEAIRLAVALEDGSYLLSQERYATANALRALHAQVFYMQEQLEAIGAGGVEALRKAPPTTQGRIDFYVKANTSERGAR